MADDNRRGGPPDEQEFIRRAKQQDVAAFNQLVLTYQNLAYSVAYRVLQEHDGACDAVQDSFVKAYRGLDGFAGGSFKSWLMRIVVNTCYDMLRSQRRRASDSLDELVAGQGGGAQPVARTEAPEAYAERNELHRLLETAIGALPEEQRVAIVLCDIHGYAYEEIAEMTEQPIGTVKSRISRARSKLRDSLLAQPELLPRSFRPKHES